jgi:hypothetical protein
MRAFRLKIGWLVCLQGTSPHVAAPERFGRAPGLTHVSLYRRVVA